MLDHDKDSFTGFIDLTRWSKISNHKDKKKSTSWSYLERREVDISRTHQLILHTSKVIILRTKLVSGLSRPTATYEWDIKSNNLFACFIYFEINNYLFVS